MLGAGTLQEPWPLWTVLGGILRPHIKTHNDVTVTTKIITTRGEVNMEGAEWVAVFHGDAMNEKGKQWLLG